MSLAKIKTNDAEDIKNTIERIVVIIQKNILLVFVQGLLLTLL